MTVSSGNISQFIVRKNIWTRVEIEFRVTKSTPESEALALQGFISKVSCMLKEDLQATGSFEVFLSFFHGISLEYKVLKHTHTHIYIHIHNFKHFQE